MADPEAFVVDLSERDAESLGASQTQYFFAPWCGPQECGQAEAPGQEPVILLFVASVDTSFGYNDSDFSEPGPCLADDVVVSHQGTGEEFVAIEAGHCIGSEWDYVLEGAWSDPEN